MCAVIRYVLNIFGCAAYRRDLPLKLPLALPRMRQKRWNPSRTPKAYLRYLDDQNLTIYEGLERTGWKDARLGLWTNDPVPQAAHHRGCGGLDGQGGSRGAARR